MSGALRSVATLALTVLLVIWLVGPHAVYAQEAPGQAAPASAAAPSQPGSGGNPAPDRSGGLLGFLPDPRQWAADVFNQVLVTLLQGIATALRKVVGGVMGSSLNFITQTPPGGSYGSPTVRALWGTVRAIANAGLALVALWGGLNLIVREQIGEPYHAAMELFPRV